MKKSWTKKGLLTMSAWILSLTIIGSPFSALALGEETQSSGVGGEMDLMSLSAVKKTAAGSYSTYLAENTSIEPASNEVVTAVEEVISQNPITFNVEVRKSGLYTVMLSYMATGDEVDELSFGLKIDNKFPFSEAEKFMLPRMWKDDAELRLDSSGNEFAAQQIPYDGYYTNAITDITEDTTEPYLFFLAAGSHTVTIIPVAGSFELQSFILAAPETPPTYVEPDVDRMVSLQKTYILEGEDAFLKNRYWLGAKADNSSAKITPHSSQKSKVNYIGGGTWKSIGETVVWETPELAEGYYQIGFSYRQSTVIGGKTYRALTVDGKTPFAEAASIGFMYGDNWQNSFWLDDNGESYLLYLSEGVHRIALTVIPGEMRGARDQLVKAVEKLSSLYVEINMITGETVDTYRDYELFDKIPDMEEKLTDILDLLNDADTQIMDITGKSSGSQSSVIKSMIQIIEQMLDNKLIAHRYKQTYYDRYCAVASVLNDMKSMPLDIDKLVLASPDVREPFEMESSFSQFLFSVQRFYYSFVNDYDNLTDDSDDAVTVWINWGRDQAQVLNQLVKSSFTQETGIEVNIQLVNASVVQGILSGKSPDCLLQQSRSEPVNLAMRGALQDLTQFNDLNDVLGRFHEGADIPYRYEGGLYGLPDTQDFLMMFYRKDIFEQLNLSVPETWDDFVDVCNRLARYNMKVWLPNSTATSVAQVNIGIGSINIYPSLLLQNDISVYSSDGRSTNLTSPGAIEVFSQWTDFYTKMKVPRALDFYNRFRIGTCPLGISSYTLYTTLKATAPEIEGLWGMALIPGTEQEDGSVSHISAGGGSACVMMKTAANPNHTWEFLKWWTRAETQLNYSNEVESLLGAAGRVSVSNVEAFEKMSWDADMVDTITAAWNHVEEIPEYPGSYYVSRSVYQSFWNVVASSANIKDTLLKYGKQADAEIQRKWKQYEGRNIR